MKRLFLFAILFAVLFSFSSVALAKKDGPPGNPRCRDEANQNPLEGKACVFHNDDQTWIEVPCGNALKVHLEHGDRPGAGVDKCLGDDEPPVEEDPEDPTEEICGDGIDNDGDGAIDEDCDDDGDDDDDDDDEVIECSVVTDHYSDTGWYQVSETKMQRVERWWTQDLNTGKLCWEKIQTSKKKIKVGDDDDEDEEIEVEVTETKAKTVAKKAKFSSTPYGDCEAKALVIRNNNETVIHYDKSDVIMIKVSEFGDIEFTNVTESWGSSREFDSALHPSGCWFVTGRVIDNGGKETVGMWHSSFGQPTEIKVNGQSVNFDEVEIGQDWQIFYTDLDGYLHVTDRAGNSRLLNVKAHTLSSDKDHNLVFVGNDGLTHTMNMAYEIIRTNEGAVISDSHPAEDLSFARSMIVENALRVFDGIETPRMNEVVQDAIEIAISPVNGQNALVITGKSKVGFTQDWRTDAHDRVQDPFAATDAATWFDLSWSN